MTLKTRSQSTAFRTFGVLLSIALAYGSAPMGFNSVGTATVAFIKDAAIKIQGRPGPYTGARNQQRFIPAGPGRSNLGRGGIQAEDLADLARAESIRFEKYAAEHPEVLLADTTPSTNAFLIEPGTGNPGLGEGLGGGGNGMGFDEMHEGGGPKGGDFGRDPLAGGGSTSGTGTAGSGDSAGTGSGSGTVGSGDGTGGSGSGTGGSGGTGGSETSTQLNSNTGNQITSLPIVSWSARGMSGVDFTIIHNSLYTDSIGNISDMGHSWSHNYSIEVATSATNWPNTAPTNLDKAYLIWMDGKRIKFTYNGTYDATLGYRFDPPTGYHAYLWRKTGSTNGWVLKTKDSWTYAFHATTNKVISQTDPWNNQITINRTSGNNITTVADGLGRSLTFLYNASNKIIKVTSADGKYWEFLRDGYDNVTQVKYPSLNSVVSSVYYTYNGNHDVLSSKNKLGKIWNFTYDADGKLLSQTNPLNKTWSVGYTATTATMTKPLGGAVVHTYSAGKLFSVRDEAMFYTNLYYDAYDNINHVQDPRGKHWYWTYDLSGNVLTTTDPTSKVWTHTYNSKSQLLTTKDPGNNVVLTLEYAGNLPAPTRVTRPLYAPTTKINYTATGEVDTTQIDFGAGVIETTADYTYDAYKNVVQVTDQTGANVYATYDTMGRPLTVTDAMGAVTTPTYDGWGRAVGATLPGGATVSVNLNVIGQVTSATDQLGRTGTVSYNDAGFVTSATNAKSETTTYAYNNNGWTTSVTNARNFARVFTYTARGEMYSLTQPDGAIETWSYNNNGDVSIYTNALSQQIIYSYDDAGRQTLVDYPTGGDTSFGYDALGRNTSMTDSVGVSSWTLNVLGQVTALTTPQGTFSYTYNTLGQPLTMTDVSGTWTTTYDAYHRATSSTNPWGETSSVVFDSYGRVNRKNIPNGMYETYSFDVLSRPTHVRTYNSSNVLQDTKQYVWDAASRVTSATEGGVVANYGYDLIDQLTSETKTALSYSASYTYDANGNRSSRTVNGVTENYAYDSADKLTGITGGARPRTFGYDLAGRTTSIVESAGTTTLNYDYDGRVTSIGYIGGGSDAFTYNGSGARVSSSGTNGSKTFRRNGTGVTDDLLDDGTTKYTPRVSSRNGSTSTFDHAGLKNTTDQTDSSQAVTASRHYDAFGSLMSSSGTWSGVHGYAGNSGYQEDGSGLKLLGYRYYDADTGRFLSQDPIGDGRNWYTYCENDPIASSDPSGLLTSVPWWSFEFTLEGTATGLNTGWGAVQDVFTPGFFKGGTNMVTGLPNSEMPGYFTSKVLGYVGLAAGVIAAGVYLAGAIRAARLAKAGVDAAKGVNQSAKHAGFRRQAEEYSENQLRKSIRSFEKNIEKHLEKVAKDPGSIHKSHWEKEMNNFREQADIAKEILDKIIKGK